MGRKGGRRRRERKGQGESGREIAPRCRAYSKEFFGVHNFKSSCMM